MGRLFKRLKLMAVLILLMGGFALAAGYTYVPGLGVVPRSKKVAVCHAPPGNPAARHTIYVSASAVRAHLAHGDHLGPCTAAHHPESGGGDDGGGEGGCDCEAQLTEIRNYVDQKFNTVNNTVNNYYRTLNTQINNVNQLVQGVEGRVSDLENRMTSAERAIEELRACCEANGSGNEDDGSAFVIRVYEHNEPDDRISKGYNLLKMAHFLPAGPEDTVMRFEVTFDVYFYMWDPSYKATTVDVQWSAITPDVVDALSSPTTNVSFAEVRERSLKVVLTPTGLATEPAESYWVRGGLIVKEYGVAYVRNIKVKAVVLEAVETTGGGSFQYLE